LAVLGHEPLDRLRQMVEERFGPVKHLGKRSLRGEEHGAGKPVIKPEDFSGLVLRVPSKDARWLSFAWQLPAWQVPLWRNKPASYASYLIGHEGEGSLLSALKERGWATSLSAGVDDLNCGSLFEVEINLTHAGMDHVLEIGELLFRYIELLKKTPPPSWVFEEMQKLRSIRFRFADDLQPYSLVNSLARNLQNFPADKVLSGPSSLPEPDVAASVEVLGCLTVDGARVELASKTLADRCTQKDPWYGGQYARLPQDPRWQQAWLAARGDADEGVIANTAAAFGLRLPSPNPFVPEALAVLPVAAPIALPVELPATSVARSFHKQDDRFRQPKASMAFRFHCPAVASDVASYLRGQLWCSAIMEELNEFAYDARSGGLAYSLSTAPGGLQLSVGGFSDKLPILVRKVVERMRDPSPPPPGIFGLVHERIEKSLKNRALRQRPCDMASRKLRELRYSLSFPVEEQLKALDGLSVESLEGESRKLLGQCLVEALLMGNLSPEDAPALVSMVTDELGLSAPSQPLPIRAQASLPPGRTVWRVAGTDPEEKNGCVLCILEVPLGLENEAYTSLLVRLLSPRFFEEIRTKQQLGYITQMTWSEGEGSLSIKCLVQTEYPPEFARGRIEAFLKEHFAWVEAELDEEEFAKQRAGLASNLREAPKNLAEEFGQHWDEIVLKRYDFSHREKELRALEAASHKGLISFVRETVQKAPRLYLEVHSISPEPCKPLPAGLSVEVEPADRVWEGDEAAVRKNFRDGATWIALGQDPNEASSQQQASLRGKL